ncbi:helicase-associated domain-containing protein [Knoellia sp. 3-2P3]|uniref:helicase-associated domain-containing protein n=1 Tax=unclassified Knoellia TaxID=2618719 RepID=UPI0023DB7139|nr:helicase-associated domain-containing protein [Knoellia sp. 3-2P3]MDF2091761.1 helicase-associated domain-containing protein [Knoellia sp. 3-2P3]
MPTPSAPRVQPPHGASAPPASAARSLADDIRARTDEELRGLLQRRPDLARPAPADLTSLAARASTRASVQRALDSLDRAHLQVLEAASLQQGPLDEHLLGEHLRAGADLGPLLHSLWASALLWRGGDGLHVTRMVAEALGPHVAGLGPWAAEVRGTTPAVLADPARIDALVEAAPEPARAILERLAWGPPLAVPPAQGAPGRVAEGARWLLAEGLVLATSADQVVLPREVGLRLRGGRVHRELLLDPPRLGGREHDPSAVDAAAGQQVSDLLVLVDELAAEWGPRPPRVLRAGGLAVRDLRRLAQVLDVPQGRAAFVAELALAAGLVGDDGSLEPVWAPTPQYDEWQQLPGAARWAALAQAWLASTRAPHLVGGTHPGATGTVNALGPDVSWPPARGLRRDVLTELERLPEGTAPEPSAIVEALRWRRPRRLPQTIDAVVAATVQEAEWLGVTGRGALSRGGRALLAETDPALLAEAMHPHLPTPVEHVLLQADLTAIAPGPLEGGLAQFMRLVADVESRGGATVYRFTPDSVRRCLDAGWSVDQVLSALTDASHTPVPQPLDYLVRDVARRHGQTRVGSVGSYVRCDDEATLGAMLADRALSALQLRRIAPTVLVSPVGAPIVLDMLRDAGYAPAAESAEGGLLVPSAGHHRTPPRRSTPGPTIHTVDDDLARTLIGALRAGEEAAAYQRAERASRPGPTLPATDPTTTLAVLREAAADRQGVWIGYSDAAGGVQRLLFYPDRVEGGRVHGTADGTARTLSIHRVTGASAT